MITEKNIELANRRREIRESYGNKCFYCREDFSNRLYALTVHHRDFHGYAKILYRDPFDHKLAKPACPQCHLKIHIAAATITLGLMKSIRIGKIKEALVEEIGLDQDLVNRVIKDLREIGISSKEIGYANRLLTQRIIRHSLVKGYYENMEEILDDC